MENLVLITGASGFIGNHLVRALTQHGFRARCLVRKTSKTEELLSCGAELAYGDVTDAESVTSAIEGTSLVFHLAGLTREMRSGDFMRVNHGGCAHVVSGCLHAAQKSGNAPVLVVLSSLAAAGTGIRAANKTDGVEVSDRGKRFRLPYCARTETMLPVPISPYGRSKLAGEREVLRYADTLPISILRPPFIFGQGDALALPLMRMAKHSWCFPIPGYFDQFYTFLHVSYLVEQIMGI
ncbi:MAG: NAD-dependent epimerase/dehydratase family protein, partial [Thermoguttaceae bacterium]|nr:NAD-dependent epimerase/dehydratase family protein [Thermoguttaceae bacterium]